LETTTENITLDGMT